MIVNNKKLYIHTNIQMKQCYDGLSCLYNYIYDNDIFVCGFTYMIIYTLLHVTVNYICPMIITKLILFYHGGSDALFSVLFFIIY